MKNSVKRVRSKQLGNMNVIEKLVKEVESIFSDGNDFSKKTISRVRAAKKKLIDSRLAMEKLDEEMDEALAETRRRHRRRSGYRKRRTLS